MHPAGHSVIAGCAVCASLHEVRPLAVAWQGPDAAAALCDGMGLCATHAGVVIAALDERSQEEVLRGATGRMLQLLSGERRDTERLLALALRASTSCPLCRLHEHRLAAIVNRVARGDHAPNPVCNEHYAGVVHALPLPMLPSFTHEQARRWDGVLASLSAPEEIEDARHWLTGSGEAGSQPIFRACPVCAGIARARDAWLESVHLAAHIGEDLWTVFPLCARDLRSSLSLGDSALAERVCQYAAATLAQATRRASDAIARDNANRVAASASVFYRPQKTPYVLGTQRRMALRLPRCPGCERLVIAQTRGLSEVLDAIGSRGVFDHQLCARHFAMAYVDAAPGAAREKLCARLRGRLDVAGAAQAGRDALLGFWSCAMPAAVA